jgi:hypothetical protein
MHNLNAKTNYRLDLIHINEVEAKKGVLDGSDSTTVQNNIRERVDELDRIYFERPGVIANDTALTVESYLQFCKQYKQDPKTYIDSLKSERVYRDQTGQASTTRPCLNGGAFCCKRH